MLTKCIPMTSRTNARKILLVEDNDLYRESLSELLETLKYQVLALPDGFAFLQCLEKFQPDIILLDLHLPPLDGFTLMKKLQKSIYKNVPIFILSASELPQEREKAIALGASRFLPKSTTVREIDRAIAEELSRS
jgi:two-component system, cell cycle response regulator DivK